MSNRLTKIVTRGGDKGETSLGDGARVAKSDPRVALLGDVDELNAWIGVALSQAPGDEVAEVLTGVQHDLFDLGGALCFPGSPILSDAHIARLDDAAASLNEGLAPLKEFVLPGGAPLIAWLHVARTVCRRVERSAAGFFALALASPSEPEQDQNPASDGAAAIAYLNRLSDFLFIASRYEAHRLGVPETTWQKAKSLS